MKFFETIVDKVVEVEKAYGASAGATKKEKVIQTVNALVDIPIIPEFLEEKVFGLVVDLVVYIFNRYNLFKTA